MSIDFSQVEFDVTNPEPRCPCVLLLDTSGSMGGKPITELNQGLQAFQSALTADELAMMRVEIAIVTFGPVKVEQDFITADQYTPQTLAASGVTPMGAAIEKALNMIDDRKQVYKQNGISYYRPWVFMVTDGAPTDEWMAAAERVKAAEAKKKVAFFSVGVEGANLEILNNISARSALKLRGLNFAEMFVWLSSSLTSVSHSTVGDEITLESPAGWGAV